MTLLLWCDFYLEHRHVSLCLLVAFITRLISISIVSFEETEQVQQVNLLTHQM